MTTYLRPTIITGILCIIALLIWPQFRIEIIAGAAIPWCIILIGHIYIVRRATNPTANSALIAFASYGVRLFAMLIAFTLVLLLLTIDEIVFIIALFFSYLYNSVDEMIRLTRLKTKN